MPGCGLAGGSAAGGGGEQLPGGDDIDDVPRRQGRELPCGIGDAQPLLQLAVVTGCEQAQVIDTGQAAWTPRAGQRAAGEGACCCAQRGEDPGQPAGRRALRQGVSPGRGRDCLGGQPGGAAGHAAQPVPDRRRGHLQPRGDLAVPQAGGPAQQRRADDIGVAGPPRNAAARFDDLLLAGGDLVFDNARLFAGRLIMNAIWLERGHLSLLSLSGVELSLSGVELGFEAVAKFPWG